MSLPHRQKWQLRGIDHALRRSDPHLATMLAIFTRLTAGEKFLAVERLRGPAWRLLARLLGGALVFGGWAVRGMGRAARRTVAVAGWLAAQRAAAQGPARPRNDGAATAPEPLTGRPGGHVTRPPPRGRPRPHP